MALFNRKNKNNTAVPAEIQEYYQAEKRDRTGIAWLLAFATLVVTILLAAGIFFAGRWAYRKIAGSDNTDTSSQVAQNEDNQQEEQPAGDSGQREEEQRAAEEKQRADEEAKKDEEERKAAEEQEAKAKEEQAQKDREEAERRRSAEAPATLPSDDGGTGGRQGASGNGNIPETGPGDTLAIFFAVSMLGYLSHRLLAGKKA